MRELRMSMGVLLVLECKVIQGMVLVKFATLDTFYYLLRIHVILFVYNIDYFLFNDQAFAVEVHEVRLCWLVSHTEFTGPQLP